MYVVVIGLVVNLVVVGGVVIVVVVGTGVEGLAEVCSGLLSEEIPASEGVVGRSSWASGLIGSMTDCDAPITSPCWY